MTPSLNRRQTHGWTLRLFSIFCYLEALLCSLPVAQSLCIVFILHDKSLGSISEDFLTFPLGELGPSEAERFRALAWACTVLHRVALSHPGKGAMCIFRAPFRSPGNQKPAFLPDQSPACIDSPALSLPRVTHAPPTLAPASTVCQGSWDRLVLPANGS